MGFVSGHYVLRGTCYSSINGHFTDIIICWDGQRLLSDEASCNLCGLIGEWLLARGRGVRLETLLCDRVVVVRYYSAHGGVVQLVQTFCIVHTWSEVRQVTCTCVFALTWLELGKLLSISSSILKKQK